MGAAVNSGLNTWSSEAVWITNCARLLHSLESKVKNKDLKMGQMWDFSKSFGGFYSFFMHLKMDFYHHREIQTLSPVKT